MKDPLKILLVFLKANYIEIKPITFEHIQYLTGLDFHHRDPFDRIIIAQAFIENSIIVTNDEVFEKYGISKIWN